MTLIDETLLLSATVDGVRYFTDTTTLFAELADYGIQSVGRLADADPTIRAAFAPAKAPWETGYQGRPVEEVTTEDLIATIHADRNDLATFEARHAFRARTGADWRVHAPLSPRTFVDPDGCRVNWHDFVETGLL
jgi:hypothetical protein